MIYETVTNLVNEKFSSSMEYASAAYDTTSELINELATTVVTPDFVEVTLSVPPIAGTLVNDVETPAQLEMVDFNGNAPEAPELLDLATVSADLPTNGSAKPTISYPNAPTMVDVGTIPSVPTVATVDLPTEVSFTEITEPTLTSVTIPVSPAFVVPSIPTVTVPVFDTNYDYTEFDATGFLVEANNAVTFLKTELNTVATTLLDFINNPTMAIGDTLKNEMIAKDRLVLADDFQTKFNEVNTYSSARGWNTPQGILNTKLAEIERARYLAEENILRDYTIKNFELSQQNMQIALQVLPQYTNSLTSLTNSILTNTLEAAKYAFESALNRYRAAIEVYKQDVEVYKVAHLAFELEMKAQSLLVEVYNSQINAVKLQLEVDSIEVELYKAMSAVQATKIELYKAKLDGAIAKMNFSKLSIDLYKAQIEGYVAGMTANNTRVQLYQSQLSAEELKLKVYNTDLQGYALTLESEKTRIAAEVATNQNLIEQNKSKVAIYDMQLKEYTANLQNIMSQNDVATKIFAGQVGLYEAASRKSLAEAELIIKEAEVNARIAGMETDAQIKQAEINMHNAINALSIQSDAMKAAGNIASQMTASALSAVSAGAHLQASSQSNENWNHNLTS